MTRPTACMISISDDLGFRKAIASREGTSTPSDRHLALDTTRHSSESPAESLNHCKASSLLVAFCVPSTCLASQPNRVSCPEPSTRFSNFSAKNFESLIRLVYAIAVWSGRAPLSGSGFSSMRYSPNIRAASVRLMSPASVVASTSFCSALPPYCSATPSTITS